MKLTPLSLIAHWAGGELHGDDAMIDAVGNDTRTLANGSLYSALRGERFDGHDFAADAVARGASGLLVERLLPALSVPQVVVKDTELALARIAASMQRDRVTRVLALTGSNGKTSVKALLLSILQEAGRVEGTTVYATPGNRNNEIGLPLAVIAAPDDADFAIYEMGAGKPGDIAYLTDIAQPHVALVNNIAPAHLERLGSLLGVAQTKGAIYAALPADGVAVINADDAFGMWFEQQLQAQPVQGRCIVRYGLQIGADITARELQLQAGAAQFTLVTPQGEAQVALPLPGRHNVLNALAATGLALGAGIALPVIAAGLAQAHPVAGRQIAQTLPSGAVLIDDSYNANPGSLDAAIDALAAAPGEGWLVLGDMRELGAEGLALHAAAGRRARAAKLQRLYALGELSAAAAQAFGDGGRVFATHGELIDALQADLVDTASRETRTQQHASGNTQEHAVIHQQKSPSTAALSGAASITILVKGSRGSAMDRVVTALLASAEGASHAA
ncbi:UDP-N-acetylmuramoyl-tripeptide--D-alanyl-D-alanine ligase [Xanthomonas oryzae pv. oryzae]|uniref:UDP-N-acetylmuramoyl-tripeptide--D-alanyl-D- alanine ligase n=1 Tax=Xanthomonas oryzae TaxID=347 RepID=UPI00094A029D|nr:UDP-N-acetylmuramoyl-tripeptide--D-alanyl-D-alanine ligase [Xanthomonas oryzae]OLH18273.1 UDP-N-acetylmuramoylalanyl-D-glutamyl-2, 6-diaminopimelate--D-alanyl-D-alanine ligase [Xanthomonas oryzae pv. oryzae]OLH72473.1 UDP-N-acetylmuramoylalanyl-D-glutamyl-2, 6-diaminopimelate--D-alanyl-D-alanine ligase [Xanthomonas oryzae pv. oryzae]OLI03528.1 UDP-N-acetylmuramoylalanyl-D-glutamyl-2, 6-diaminopimelate--D-alanyl-D-alanine ligase [Xanthomonas oryzae pv. oryzae]OLI18102.1 UDP-N-acetylmuramoylal